jgi:hypothetical protein
LHGIGVLLVSDNDAVYTDAVNSVLILNLRYWLVRDRRAVENWNQVEPKWTPEF